MVGRITYGCPNINKANLRDVIAATGLVISPKLNLKRRFFSPCDLEIWWMTSKNYRVPLLHYIKLCASSQTPRCSGQNRWFFVPYDLEIWWMTLKNNRAPLPCYIKLCASFQAIGEFELELHSGNAQFGSESEIFCPMWPWNLVDGLEKQQGTSSMLLQALFIIS